MKKICLPIFVSFILLTISFTQIQADEPNDSFAIADTLLAGVENALTAELTVDDQDYYSFTVQSGESYVIETFGILNANSADNHATGLYLYDFNHNEILRDNYGADGHGDANASINYDFVVGGTYYVKVVKRTSSSWTGTYSIRLLKGHDPDRALWDTNGQADLHEPNNIFAQAYPINVGLDQAITSTIFNNTMYASPNADTDTFYFTATAGTTYVIQTFDIINPDVTDNYAVRLYLYSESGDKIAEDVSTSSGIYNVSRQIILDTVVSGKYYIYVVSSQSSWVGAYKLRVLPEHNDPLAAWHSDNEPNNALHLATELPISQEGLLSSLADGTMYVSTNSGDVDYYHFYADADTPYTIRTFNTSATTDRATGIYLYDSGRILLANDQDGRGSDYADAEITYTFPQAGTYYVSVANQRFSAWTGDYAICVTDTALPCQMSAPTAIDLKGAMRIETDLQIIVIMAVVMGVVTCRFKIDWMRWGSVKRE